MTKNLNVSKRTGSNPVGSMYISFIHQFDYRNKINMLLYIAATNMQWINYSLFISISQISQRAYLVRTPRSKIRNFRI